MGLKDRFDEAARRNDVKAIVLTGKCLGLFYDDDAVALHNSLFK